MILIRRCCVAFAALAFTALVAQPAVAHHSFAMFDQSKEQILKGTIREFQWVNPHGWIQIVVDEEGKPVEYSIETVGIVSLVKMGFRKTTLKPGDNVTVVMHPMRDGTKGGEFLSVTLADGKTLKRGGDQ